jgi:hypothetical protein
MAIPGQLLLYSSPNFGRSPHPTPADLGNGIVGRDFARSMSHFVLNTNLLMKGYAKLVGDLPV